MKISVKDKQTLLLLINEHKEELRQFGIKQLGLFGSFVKGEQDASSDVDLLVEFEKGRKTYKNFIHLAFYLEELFNRKVELLTPQSISPYLKSHIMNEIEYVIAA